MTAWFCRRRRCDQVATIARQARALLNAAKRAAAPKAGEFERLVVRMLVDQTEPEARAIVGRMLRRRGWNE